MMWVAGFPILFNTKDVLWYWLGEVPEYTIVFTQLVIFRCFLKVFERPLITSQMAHGRMKFPSIITGGFLILEVFLRGFYSKMVILLTGLLSWIYSL